MEPECAFPCLQKLAVKHNANKNLFQICLLLKCWSELDLYVSQKIPVMYVVGSDYLWLKT
jgi:hypothetical protein